MSSKGIDRDDPLTLALAPPEHESLQDRERRLRTAMEAKRRSDDIDEEISRTRAAEKKKGLPVKILLLGQSESGKSTTLKNFQIMNSQKAFRAELPSWRAVIQLNILRSIRVVIETLNEAHSHQVSPSDPYLKFPPQTSHHLQLRARLSPLLQAEESLTRKLTLESGIRGEAVDSAPNASTNTFFNTRKELSVHSRSSWKSSFKKHKGIASDREEDLIDWDDPADPGKIIYACRDDMIELWNDTVVKSILKVAKVRMEEHGGFFLDQLPRVTSERYIPTNDDILRARLKTVGVTEYCFRMGNGINSNNTGHGISISSDWRVYDVGGHRSLRAAWVPFFDDMNAIIFLAPISCFDQVLEEDETVNRLEDSVQLWTSVISNQLLADTQLVLFLNKCDILESKLSSGIQFAKYIVSYGSRPNDFDSASSYLRKKFANIHKEKSPRSRTFYCHFTSVTDSNTPSILRHIQDSVIVKNLKQGGLM